MKVAVVACQVLRDLIEDRLDPSIQAIYLDYGLHRYPQKMVPAIEDALKTLPEPSLVLMGYGLCGNGLAGLRAGPHTLVVPRSADCISIILGSYESYMHEVAREPGTIYLSKGWIECGSEPLKEYQDYVEKYGEETAKWLLDEQYKNYRRLCFVACHAGDVEQYGQYAREVAGFCKMEYEERVGTSDFMDALLRQREGPTPGEDFVIVPPGQVVEQSQFFR